MSEAGQEITRMTYADIIAQTLSEVTGKPKEIFMEVLNSCPPPHRLNDEVPDGEAEAMLDQLRQEKSGILNWVIEGRRKALASIHAQAQKN